MHMSRAHVTCTCLTCTCHTCTCHVHMSHMHMVVLSISEGVRLEFTDDAVREIAHCAAVANRNMENIGARRLHAVMERILDDLSFTASDLKGQTVVVDAARVSLRCTYSLFFFFFFLSFLFSSFFCSVLLFFVPLRRERKETEDKYRERAPDFTRNLLVFFLHFFLTLCAFCLLFFLLSLSLSL